MGVRLDSAGKPLLSRKIANDETEIVTLLTTASALAALFEAPAALGNRSDLVGRDFTADAPRCKVLGDITYIPTWASWLFLTTVVDFNQDVVGYAMADHMRTSLVADALDMAAQPHVGCGSIFPTAACRADSTGRRNTST